MSISKKIEQKNNPQQKVEEEVSKIIGVKLSQHELEFLIRMIGDSNFKGKDLMFIYDLVKKLQDSYVENAGGQ
tara:strand:- start:1394 stop:1612 length:219 start_codon:yes stop_codon:yes gene_type:complete